jgi:hypothetical protein
MRVIKSGRMSIAASLLLCAVAVAHAADNSYASVQESKAVKAPSLPWNDPTVQRVAPASAYHYAEPRPTAKFGTGTAAGHEMGVASFRPVSAVKPHYPEPQWSSTIGSGTAATLKR